jgi:type VI secretion system protein ImpL
VLGFVALAGFSAAVWFAGPLIGFAGSHPLQPAWTRAAIAAAAVLLVAAGALIRWLIARNAQRALAAAMAGLHDADSDAPVLEKRMQDAIDTLRRASGKRNFLYDVPWYVVIGPPGAGKTTALVNSGLRFPLAGADAARPVAGVGGTRNCDWWFTDDAILIDTAGRYTMQGSDAAADSRSWLAFLALLKKYRPRQPVNGVIVAISLAELMTGDDAAAGTEAAKIRARLKELHEALKIDFPVYVLFTKADLVAGFMEFFGDLDEARRRTVWGATFQTAERGKNTVGLAPAEFDALANRLTQETADRLQQVGDPASRVALFGLAARFAALKPRVTGLLATVFDQPAARTGSNLRGFYFSSGTQEGTPIDQLLGSIGRSFGGDARPHLSGSGKSFFLHDLLAKVVFAESGWASFDRSADRRARILRSAAFGLVGLAGIAVLGVFGLSFLSNRALVSATSQALAQYRAAAGPLASDAPVADTDLGTVIAGLDTLRDLPVGYAVRDAATPVEETVGFSQRPRLVSAASEAYREALERGLRSRLLLQLEQTIQARIAEPAALYEPLKVYLMLGGQAPRSDDETIVRWMKRDWEENRYPGPSNRAGRADLEDHLRAMLALDDDQNPTFALNKELVESAQRSLGRMTVADRASALLASAADAAKVDDFWITERGGPEARSVFEGNDGSELTKLGVPGIYTYDGFHRFYLGQLAGVAQSLVDEQWVIGAGGEQGGVEPELLRLGPELLDRYARNFAAAWNGMLGRLRFKSMTRDGPDYLVLSAAGAPASPIGQLFEAVATETALTRPPRQGSADPAQEQNLAAGLARIGIVLPSGKSQDRAGAAFAAATVETPGAGIEAQFRPYQLLVTGQPGQRPVDALIQNFRDIYQTMLLAASAPAQGERANANLQLQIATLRTNASRLPRALANMVRQAADDFDSNAAESSIAQLNKSLAETVTAACQKAIADRYPFAPGSSDEVPVSDFAALFAPNGIIDRYFAQYLAPLVDMSSQSWEWKQDSRLGQQLSKATLKEFQLAAEIRDAFFPLGSSAPSVSFTVTPFSLHTDADQAVLDFDGQTVQSYQNGSGAGTIAWPGGGAEESASLTLSPEMPGRDSSMTFQGAWALKRLLDAGATTRNGDALEARFVIGGRDVSYTIKAGPTGNPFAIPALSGFSCPTTF